MRQTLHALDLGEAADVTIKESLAAFAQRHFHRYLFAEYVFHLDRFVLTQEIEVKFAQAPQFFPRRHLAE